MREEVDEEEAVLLVESRKRKKVVHLASMVPAFGVPKKGINLTLAGYPQTSCGVTSVDQETTILGQSSAKKKEVTEAGETPAMDEVLESDPEIGTEEEMVLENGAVIETLQLIAIARAEQGLHPRGPTEGTDPPIRVTGVRISL